MAEKQTKGSGNVHVATARMRNLPISTKHSIEISRHLRFKPTSKAKAFLEEVVLKAKPIPFKRFVRDIGHKAGMASGRYPVKAAKEFLSLIKSSEKNAEDLGLNTESLKIVHLLANKASIPMTGGRMRGATKRTHLEIKVAEVAEKKKVAKKVTKKPAVKKEEKKVETPKTKEVSGIEKVKKEEVKETKVEEKPVPKKEEAPSKKTEDQKTQDTTKGESQ